MIILEQITKQILREEGQIVISLSDLGITWKDIEGLFIGTYEQSKDYLSIYDWTADLVGLTPHEVPFTHIKHITYNAYYQELLPDVPDNYWEFNPYTKNMSSLINSTFAMEVGKHATLDNLTYTLSLKNIKKGKVKKFDLPFTPEDIVITSDNKPLNIDTEEVTYDYDDKNSYLDASNTCICCNSNDGSTQLEVIGDANGTINSDTLSGELKFNKDYDNLNLQLTSKYKGILELDMSCELFYKWFKGNLLTMIGSTKAQIDMSSTGLPFDLKQDNLLERGRQILDSIEELKASKQHWSNF